MWLGISTAHDACSAALIADGAVLAQAHEAIGRGHDSRLAPMVRDLLDGVDRRPERVVVDIGPGSFTGIRVGVAMARGLGLGWGIPVHGCASDRIVAAQAFAADTALERVWVLLDGRRGELFARAHDRTAAEGEPLALRRDAAEAVVAGAVVAGPGAALAGLRGARVLTLEASAAAMRLLASQDCALAPQPIYVRAPHVRPAQ